MAESWAECALSHGSEPGHEPGPLSAASSSTLRHSIAPPAADADGDAVSPLALPGRSVREDADASGGDRESATAPTTAAAARLGVLAVAGI